MIIKLILIGLSNSFSNFYINMKKGKRTIFRFPFFYENEKRTKILKIQRKKSIKHENGSQLFEFRLSY